MSEETKRGEVEYSTDGKEWRRIPGARVSNMQVHIEITGLAELKTALDEAAWTLHNLRKSGISAEASGPWLDDPNVVDSTARDMGDSVAPS